MKGWNAGYSNEEAAPVQVLHFEEEKTFQNVLSRHKFSTWYCQARLHAQHLTQTVNYSSGADIWSPVRLFFFSNLWSNSH